MKERFKFNTVGLFTRDNKATVDFYTKTFNFATDWDGIQPNVEMTLGDMRIILYPHDAFEQMVSRKFQYPEGFNGTMELAFDVPTFADVDKEYQHALRHGAISVLSPTTQPWGQRTCYVADPDGNLIEIGSFTKQFMKIQMESRIDTIEIESNALAKTMAMKVYVPVNGSEGMPVLYLMHGRSGDENMMYALDIPSVADKMIGAGSMQPMLIVCPRMDDALGLDAYESYFFNEVMPRIKKLYHTGVCHLFSMLLPPDFWKSLKINRMTLCSAVFWVPRSILWCIERAFRMNKGDLRARPIFHRLHNRIETHLCICFTAYTIMLQLERLLKQAKSEITIYQAGHLTKTMYQLNYQTPKTHRRKSVILQMDSEQQELYDIVSRNVPEE